MAEKSIPQPASLVCSFDQTRNVRNHKASIVPITDHPQVRDQRCERIVGDFGPGCGNHGDKCRLPCIGVADQTDVGQHLELKGNKEMLTREPFLKVLGGLVGR